MKYLEFGDDIIVVDKIVSIGTERGIEEDTYLAVIKTVGGGEYVEHYPDFSKAQGAVNNIMNKLNNI